MITFRLNVSSSSSLSADNASVSSSVNPMKVTAMRLIFSADTQAASAVTCRFVRLSLKFLLSFAEFIYPHFTVNPFFALDIFICSFRKCIQHTTRGQSNFPLSKLCCCYIFIVLKYWWQNSITAHIYAN